MSYLINHFHLTRCQAAARILPTECLAVTHIEGRTAIVLIWHKAKEQGADNRCFVPLLLQPRPVVRWKVRFVGSGIAAPVHGPTGAEGMQIGHVIEEARQMDMTRFPIQ